LSGRCNRARIARKHRAQYRQRQHAEHGIRRPSGGISRQRLQQSCHCNRLRRTIRPKSAKKRQTCGEQKRNPGIIAVLPRDERMHRDGSVVTEGPHSRTQASARRRDVDEGQSTSEASRADDGGAKYDRLHPQAKNGADDSHPPGHERPKNSVSRRGGLDGDETK